MIGTGAFLLSHFEEGFEEGGLGELYFGETWSDWGKGVLDYLLCLLECFWHDSPPK